MAGAVLLVPTRGVVWCFGVLEWWCGMVWYVWHVRWLGLN